MEMHVLTYITIPRNMVYTIHIGYKYITTPFMFAGPLGATRIKTHRGIVD